MTHGWYLRNTLFLFGMLALTVAGSARANECVGCHSNPDFFVEHRRLHNYYQQWLDSPHDQAGVTCDDCHGGNPRTASMGKAHKGVLPVGDSRSTLHFRNQPDTCGQCHRSVKAQFVRSKHFAALRDQRAAPTCTTCHSAMSRRPELRSIVLNACRNCHGEGNSENLPLITRQAEDLFHQLNILEGQLGWTRIHYETLGWPEDSRERMRDLKSRHGQIVNQVHQFELEGTAAAAVEMLAELRRIFEAARRAFDDRNRLQRE